jgi:hypothetical protein
VLEMVRTGRVAMDRGSSASTPREADVALAVDAGVSFSV